MKRKPEKGRPRTSGKKRPERNKFSSGFKERVLSYLGEGTTSLGQESEEPPSDSVNQTRQLLTPGNLVLC